MVPFNVQQVGEYTVVEFTTTALMDPIVLEQTGAALYRLVEQEDRRLVVLDFEKVQFMSSPAIGIVLNLNKKLSELKNSRLVLCGVGQRLAELLRITCLDRILTVKPSQREAINTMT